LKGSPALLALVFAAQLRTVDLSRPPWNRVMSRLQANDRVGAAHALEDIAARDAAIAPWQHAYAWRWAGRLEMEAGRTADATRDFEQAIARDPQALDARYARVHLGEIALREHRDADARRWLEPVEHDPDALVRAYAQDRLRTARERLRRLWLRRGTIGIVVVALLALLTRIARPSRWRGRSRAFGRTLLVAEGVAIAGTLVIARYVSSLALSGWMLAALPCGLAAATLWATRDTKRSILREALVWIAFAIAFAAALHLAWDLLWWSAERPLE
jgi:hypothetical protein